MPITYFRSPHRPEALNERFEAEFNFADILFLEQAYGDFYRFAKTHYDQLSRLGYSNVGVRDTHFDEFQTKQESFIRGSGKQIELERSPITKRQANISLNLMAHSFLSFDKGDFKKACDFHIKSAIHSALQNIIRDQKIAEQLETLEKINKNKYILALMGGSHEFQIPLHKKAIKVKQKFPYEPYIFGFVDQLERGIRFGKKPTKELAAKAIIGNIISTYLKEQGEKVPTYIEREIEITDKLSYEQIETLSNHISKHIGKEHRNYLEVPIEWLKKQGFVI